MANKKISECTSLTNAELAAGDVLPIVDSNDGVTKKISIAELDARYKTPFDAILSQVQEVISLTAGLNLILHSIVGNLDLDNGSSIVFFDATIGNQTFTPPDATDNEGRTITFKRMDASVNTASIIGTIEGVVNPEITGQYTTWTIIAYGGSWYWRD